MTRASTRLLLIVLVLGAFALRCWRLDTQELRGDEVFGYFFSLRTLPDMVQATVDLREPHPVLSYYLQHLWLGWAGHSEFSLRFTSLWFGVLAVALLWAVGRRLLTAPAALLGTLLLSISPYAIWHSQDARMYSMSLALTLASTLLMVVWLQRQRRRLAIAYVVVTLLALHTHYFAVFVIVAQNLFVVGRALWLPRLRLTGINWLVLQLTVAFFYGPWVLRVQTILRDYEGNGDSPGLGAMIWRALSVLAVGESTAPQQRFWWAWLAGFLLVGGAVVLWCRGDEGRRTLALLGLYLGVPLLATWWSALQRPIFNERYLVAALPGFCLLVGALVTGRKRFAADVGTLPPRFQPRADTQNPLKRVEELAHRRLKHRWNDAVLNPLQRVWPIRQWFQPLLSACLVLLLGGQLFSLPRYYGDPAYSKTRGWRDLATTLTAWSADLPPEQVRIAQNFPDPTLWYYYRGPVDHLVLPPRAHDGVGAQETVTALAAAGVRRVLLPRQPAPNWDAQEIAGQALAAEYTLALETTVGVWPLQLYSRIPSPLPPLTVTFQNGLQLVGAAIQGESVMPGSALVVALAWQPAAAQLTGSEKVFVQLLDGQGQLVAQQDRPLALSTTAAAAPVTSVYGILLPERLPAGPYQLITGLYDPALAGAPRLLTAQGADLITLHTFE